MKTPLLTRVLLLVASSTVPAFSATTIAEFGFTGNSLSSTDSGTSWTTSDLGSGGGVPLGFDGSEGQPAPSLALTMGDINDGTLKDNDYYSFTITPSTGATISFTQFSIAINKISGGADVYARLFSSQDTYATEIGNAQVSPTNEWNTYNIDLSGLSSVTSAVPIQFRIYLETAGTFAPNEIKLDNIITTGEVSVIPEPSLSLIAGLGGVGLLLRRRR